MIKRYGPSFTFWLNYLDSHGGLWERSGDTVLAMLPEQLGARHELPESALITDDPDIAREDGVLFLGAGHPEIDKGAEAIMDAGDIGAFTVPHTAKPLSTEDLLTKIRDRVPVAHGRIDHTGSILRSHRPMLRLGALASHLVSAEEQFTEAVECLVDVPSRIIWPRAAAARLRATAAAETTPRPEVPAAQLAQAVTAGHRELDTAATRRVLELAADADTERAAEIARASEYYAEALTAIDRRRANADAQRQALLDARAHATIGERDRRLAEIDEKYRPEHVLRPYRLQLIDIPVWRLATDVRRGDRRWPMTFDYLPLLGVVAPTRCPACDAHSPLVATKTHLGCETCVPAKTPLRPVSEPPAAKTPARAQPRQPKVARSTPARKSSVPFLPGEADERTVAAFWDHVGASDTRKLSRLIAPDSPLAALIRLYRSAGPLNGIGIPAGQPMRSFSCENYRRPVTGRRGATCGEVRTPQDEYPYLLLWSSERRLEEILPYSMPWNFGQGPILTSAPATHLDLDGVARLLFTRTTARHGLSTTTRTLAAWWRLPDPDSLLARFSPRVLAAAVERAVRHWAGLSGAGYPEVAAAFRAGQPEVRGAAPMLQKQLQLGAGRQW